MCHSVKTNFMSRTSVILVILGIVVILAGIAFISLDLAGMGDTHGFDPKDIGIIVVGLILLIIGAVVRSRKPSASIQSQQPTTS
jgi:uncharacterized membrane protein